MNQSTFIRQGWSHHDPPTRHRETLREVPVCIRWIWRSPRAKCLAFWAQWGWKNDNKPHLGRCSSTHQWFCFHRRYRYGHQSRGVSAANRLHPRPSFHIRELTGRILDLHWRDLQHGPQCCGRPFRGCIGPNGCSTERMNLVKPIHGMKQRLVLSAAILHDPPVLIVDEPMVGLIPMVPSASRHSRTGPERAYGILVHAFTGRGPRGLRPCGHIVPGSTGGTWKSGRTHEFW